jgi:hypothetical protein
MSKIKIGSKVRITTDDIPSSNKKVIDEFPTKTAILADIGAKTNTCFVRAPDGTMWWFFRRDIKPIYKEEGNCSSIW